MNPDPGTNSSGKWRWRGAVEIAVVLVAVALAHGRAVGNGFVSLDDDVYITDNAHVQRGLTGEGVVWAFKLDNRSTYFHPLTWLSLMLDAELFGVEAWGFHLVNLLLHGASALAVFFLFARTTGRRGASLLAALIWGVHPLTVEAVAWCAERKAVLSTLIGLLACHAHVSCAGGRRPARMLGVLALAAAAMLAKPALVVLPVLLIVLDWWPLGRLSWSRDAGAASPRPGLIVVEKIPLVIISAAVLAVGIASLTFAIAPTEAQVPLSQRVLQSLAAIRSYLQAAVWPTDLAVFRPYPLSVSAADAAVGGALAVTMTGVALALARPVPFLLAGWGWFLVTISPYLGLKQAGLWPSWADRFAYLPLVGLAVAVAFLLDTAWARFKPARPFLAAVVGVGLVMLGAATFRQVTVWKDSVSLYDQATRIEPEAAVIQFNYGQALVRAGRLVEAKARFAAAVKTDWRLSQAQCDLGTILILEGDFAGAEARYRAALLANPTHPQALFNLAETLRQRGRATEAAPYFRRFVESAPGAMEHQVAWAHTMLGE